jgi:ribonuclease P protein component
VDERRRSFSHANKLTKPAEFDRVFASKLRAVAGQFTALARENGLRHARLGLAIPRQRVRTAVARNRIKRMVRESFRIHQQGLEGLDVVVMLSRNRVRADGGAPALAQLWEKVARCRNS